MKRSSRNYTKEQREFLESMNQIIIVEMEMDRVSLLMLAHALSLVVTSGSLPLEACHFCTEVIESFVEILRKEVGFDDKFKLINPEEFWGKFFPCPKGVSPVEQKKKILETFKKHRADWRKLWTVD